MAAKPVPASATLHAWNGPPVRPDEYLLYTAQTKLDVRWADEHFARACDDINRKTAAIIAATAGPWREMSIVDWSKQPANVAAVERDGQWIHRPKPWDADAADAEKDNAGYYTRAAQDGWRSWVPERVSRAEDDIRTRREELVRRALERLAELAK